MSEADLLRLLGWAPQGIVALAVVAALALYEILAPNPRRRARQGPKPSAPEPAHPSTTDGQATVASFPSALKPQSPKVLAFDRSPIVGISQSSVVTTDTNKNLAPPKLRDLLMLRSENRESSQSATKGQTMPLEKHALELAATLEESIARRRDAVLEPADSELVARALRLFALASAEISGDRPLISLEKSA